ncbi:MAG: ribosome silencing factor [Lachnospiraceae bacterium]|nr:ribosome silencing factor [Lachnospiraceae bacterium]
MLKEESRKLVELVVHALEEKKAENIEVIEIDQISPLADFFVIANGTNPNQTEAMLDAVQETAAKNGFETDHVEGRKNANWTLIDFKGVVVHIFDEESRAFYDLARIWKDGSHLDPQTLEPIPEGE